jgi:hypothetical protein
MVEPISSYLFGSAFEPEVVTLLGAALDSAWDFVLKSGSPIAADGQAELTRERLAKHIIENARRGERDPKRLVDAALSDLTVPRSS